MWLLFISYHQLSLAPLSNKYQLNFQEYLQHSYMYCRYTRIDFLDYFHVCTLKLRKIKIRIEQVRALSFNKNCLRASYFEKQAVFFGEKLKLLSRELS